MICNKTESCLFKLLESPSQVQCANKSNCFEYCDTRAEAVCSEKGKKYRLLNTSSKRHKILSIHVDDGLIRNDAQTPSNTPKCDYLYLIDTEEKPVGVLIELKGKHLNKAIEQISNTLRLFKPALSKCKKLHGRVVFAGGTPDIHSPQYMSLQRELKRSGGNLVVGEKIGDKIEEII